MTIKDRITEAMKTSMRAHDAKRLNAIRLILAAFKQIEVDKRITIDDPQAIDILSKLVKQRQDSITQYKTGHREDLVVV